jgi:ATP-dependent Lhr-like helicase
VATSSLDLGVDFPAVDQVLQLGSPKGMARLLQRAGRASHRPGEPAHVVCVPTHALELIEYAAAREALAHGRIEPRPPPRLSLDVLAQHCVTVALGGGFDADALYDEVRGTHAFAELDPSWRSSCRAAARSRITPTTGAWCATTAGASSSRIARWPSGIGCRSARSPATAASR